MVDILLASYNGEKYIEEQMASIAAQTYSQWKLFVCDDRSQDDTVAKAERFAQAYNQNHSENDIKKITIKVNDKACGGAAANFFNMLSLSTSEYIMFCDQDDMWKADKVEKTLKRMRHLERKYGSHVPLLVYTDLAVVDENLKMIAPSFIKYMNIPPKITLSRLLLQNSVTGCTVMMNRTLCQLLCKATEFKKIAMHDHFAALTAQVFGKISFLPEATLSYRQHGNNSVGASDARSLSYLYKRYRRGKKQFRQDMYVYMIQAGYFYELYHDRITDPKTRDLIYGWAHLFEKNKLYRISFYIKNHVVKYGWIRAVMQMLWG